jgi:prepilin-type N-terminal cleavage/methylation domain-containing protein
MKTHRKKNQRGFTLLEFIVALVVASIVASMVYTYFGGALTQSSVPIARLQQVSKLQQVMENIVAEYERLNQVNMRFKWRSGQAYAIGDIVSPSTSADNTTSQVAYNGRYYICTTAGTSSTTQPFNLTLDLTDTTLGRTVPDGSVVWTEKGYVWQVGRSYPANAVIVPKMSNGHFYMGPNAAFISGSSEPCDKVPCVNPPWPTGLGGTVTDGAVTWTEVGTILERSDNNDHILYYLANTPGRYDGNSNSYVVVSAETKFIQFDDSTKTEMNAGASGVSSERNLLKVTLKNANSAEALTKIFTIR